MATFDVNKIPNYRFKYSFLVEGGGGRLIMEGVLKWLLIDTCLSLV